MITVGCAGFAVPATRYFKEYGFVEIQETHRAAPGPGTIRRWRREAPKEFEFAVLGPREVTQEGFRLGKVVETALAALGEVAVELKAKMAVFVAAPDFAPSRPNKTALREFLGLAKSQFEIVVFEPGLEWNPDEADSLASETNTFAARDPLQHGPSTRPTAYYRLPGPAGHKSRYEDPAIERLAELAHGARHESVHYVFTNVDMFADAKRFKKAYGI
ncbi:MAG TPA: DUF72 domain-containing protein [Polyangiaceae bacterium]|jgi:uncharacterized protein YecE (DUF72 family)|nr:DUF72 domain-containing protein [Polyangiaceae bacterium]